MRPEFMVPSWLITAAMPMELWKTWGAAASANNRKAGKGAPFTVI
jgi:hypothetical protein